MGYSFGSVELDPRAFELVVDGDRVELEPQAFAVLCHLVEHRDRVVPKEELLDEIWGDRFVSESALTTRIKQARRAVGDDGRSQWAIRTTHGVGYRFVAEVAVRDGVGGGPSGPEAPADRPGDPGGLTAVPLGPGGVLAPRTRLVGREESLARLAALLDRHRLVTVLGPGGIGKTHLCSHVASTHADGEAVWLLELAHVRRPEAVTSVVLDHLGVADRSGLAPAEALVRSLGDRSAFLVLDNCEHVAGAVAELADLVLARCPRVRVLATSRVPLDVAGEAVMPLGPLQVRSAVELFVERAAAAGAAVDPDDPAVEELCRRLDGMPLALELAAARARTLGPAELVELLADRFRLLRRSGSVDDRHRALADVVGWSWASLDEGDRAVLGALSVFAGPFTRRAATAVVGADDELGVAEALDRLVAHSLVVATRGTDGRTRFMLLESIREYAQEHVADDALAAARRRHAHFYADRVEELADLSSSDPDDAFARMSGAWANIREAVAVAEAAGELDLVRRLVAAVGGYADLFLVHEVLDWCHRARLDEPSGDPSVRAAALAVSSRLHGHRGRYDEGVRLAAAARAIETTDSTILADLFCAYYTGDFEAGERAMAELAARHPEWDLGAAYHEVFQAFFDDVLGQPPRPGRRPGVVPAEVEDGLLGTMAALAEGLRLSLLDAEAASPYFVAVIETALARDYRLVFGAASSSYSQVNVPRLPPLQGAAVVRDTLARYLEHQMWSFVAADVVMAARLLVDAGRLDPACRLVGFRRASGYTTGLSQFMYEDLRTELVGRMGPDAEELMMQGRALDEPAAARLAVAELSALVAAGAAPGDPEPEAV